MILILSFYFFFIFFILKRCAAAPKGVGRKNFGGKGNTKTEK